MSIHCTHPDELTEDMRDACTRLADAGIPLGSQTVLLAGINDSVETYASYSRPVEDLGETQLSLTV